MLMSKLARSSLRSTLILAAIAVVSAASAAGSDVPGSVVFKRSELNRCEAVRKRQSAEDRNRIYDSAYSTYVEICAASTWQMRGASDGGNYGHAFGIIKGACIVRDANGKPAVPPQLTTCPGGWVGVSSDYILFNVQWLAVEGRDFFLYGGHDPGQPLDEPAAARIKGEAVSRGVFEGVEFHKTFREEIARDAQALGLTPEAYRPLWEGKASLGTDFGIAVSRGGVDCTRIPMLGTKPGFEDKPLKDLIAHLNKMNLKIYNENAKIVPPGKSEPVGFEYDSAVNNCTTNFSNALAATGFWRMKNTEGHPESMLDLIARGDDIAVPYNTMFDAYKRGSGFDLEGTLNELRRDRRAFEYFKTTGWLGSQAGTMLESIPALEYMNSVYNTSNNTNFASFVYEAQKKALLSLRDNALVAMLGETSAGKFVRNLVRDWLGVDLGDLKPIPPSDKRAFDRIRADESDVGTNMLENLKYWKALYARYLVDLRKGRFGNDEVVREMKTYLKKKLEQTSALLARSDRLKPTPLEACPRE